MGSDTCTFFSNARIFLDFAYDLYFMPIAQSIFFFVANNIIFKIPKPWAMDYEYYFKEYQ